MLPVFHTVHRDERAEFPDIGVTQEQARRHPILGTGSVHASLIRGGEELSSYPAACRVSLERRTVPGETGDMVEAQLRELLDAIARKVDGFCYRIERGLERVPFESSEAEPIVACLRKHASQVLGRPPAARGEPFWTDCAILQEAGIPCLMFGADGAGAHAATEWGTIASVEAVTKVLEETAVDFCGTPALNPR